LTRSHRRSFGTTSTWKKRARISQSTTINTDKDGRAEGKWKVALLAEEGDVSQPKKGGKTLAKSTRLQSEQVEVVEQPYPFI
jgi:hypothetical protein